jgi:hypothetical protein
VRALEAPTLEAFLANIRNDLDVTWTDISAYSGLTTKWQMKNAVMQMFDRDDAFHESVKRVVDTDADLASVRRDIVRGACAVGGKCAIARTTPSTRLFDGHSDVTFAVMEDTGTVVYTRDGVTHETHALPCDASNERVCEDAHDLGDELTLTGGTTPVVPTYKIHGHDSEFVVMNSLSVTNESRCASRICELNKTACPSSMCTVDEDKNCVPRS